MILKFNRKLRKLRNFYTVIIRDYSKSTMPKKALVFLAPGAEEMEFVIAVDVLRRGGIDVTIASLAADESPVQCSRGVMIVPDVSIAVATSNGPYDAIVLPGGLGGSKALSVNEEVGKLLKEQENAGKIIAAICAAPLALKAHNIAGGKNITCYPGVKDDVCLDTDFIYNEDVVVVDGNITTSRGPGTAFDFALNLVDQLTGKKNTKEVAEAMLLTYPSSEVTSLTSDDTA